MGYFDSKRTGEERNPKCPAFTLLGAVDTTLERNEYYVEDVNGKVVKGWVTGLYLDMNGTVKHILRNGRGRIDSGMDDMGGFRKGNMYDNKEDCRNEIHLFYDNWEL